MKTKITAILCMLIAMMQACTAQEVPLDSVALPESFRETTENVIENPEALSRFYAKLKADSAQVRVLHIGDSHVRGNFFPGNARKALEVSFGSKAMEEAKIGYNEPSMAVETGLPGLVYSSMGINGATTKTFYKADRLQKIAAFKPDLIIVSFGTNEGYGEKYNSEKHAYALKSFIDTLRYCCGSEVEFLLTTPPGCFKRDAQKQFYPNPHNDKVARTITVTARECDAALWNIFEIAGGYLCACDNWKNDSLMQPDGVHFNKQGYELQGRLLGQAIAKGYTQVK